MACKIKTAIRHAKIRVRLRSKVSYKGLSDLEKRLVKLSEERYLACKELDKFWRDIPYDHSKSPIIPVWNDYWSDLFSLLDKNLDSRSRKLNRLMDKHGWDDVRLDHLLHSHRQNNIRNFM